jgi:hypothetical protein
MAEVLQATAVLLISFALFLYACRGLLDAYGHGYQAAMNPHNSVRPIPSQAVQSPCLRGSWAIVAVSMVQAVMTPIRAQRVQPWPVTSPFNPVRQ